MNMEMSMDSSQFPASPAEAQRLGFKRIAAPESFALAGWGAPPEESSPWCYTGPCEPGTGARTVCYLDANGECKDCYLVPTHECGS